jgi:hypothetical protein
MSFQNVLLAVGVAGALLGLVPHASAAVDAIVHLDQLVCIKESEDGSEPYAWTALVTGTLASLSTGDIKVVAPRVSNGARAVIKKGMRAGERANMPAAQLVQQFSDGEVGEVGFVAIVVVLLEDDGLPQAAIQAGYQRFLEVLKTELSSFFKAGGVQPNPQDLAALRRAIEPKVQQAVTNALSLSQKLLIVFKGQDDILGFNDAFTLVARPAAATPFTLSIEHKVTIPGEELHPSNAPPIVVSPAQEITTDAFQLEGRFEARRTAVLPPPPPGQPGVVRDHRGDPRVPPRPPGSQEP